MTRSELAEACVLRLRLALNVELAELCDRECIDMSREAITARVRELAELSTLCLELGRASSHPSD